MGKVVANTLIPSTPCGLRWLWVASIFGLAALMVFSKLPWLVFLSGIVGCIGGAAGILIELARKEKSRDARSKGI